MPRISSDSESGTPSTESVPAVDVATDAGTLDPPKARFFVGRTESSNSIDEVPRDPFGTPDHSVPSTPSLNGMLSNPFSAPNSVVNLRSGLSSTKNDETLSRGASSQVSVPSGLRNSTADRRPRLGQMGSGFRDSFTAPAMMVNKRNTDGYNSATMPMKAAPKHMRSTLLTGEIEKPWVREKKDPYMRIAYLITYGTALFGLIGSGLLCYFGWKNVLRVGNLCMVMEDNFDTFDTNVWSHEVDLGGFGNGEFEMTTNSPNNSFVKDGHLYIVPTLTSDVIGKDAVLNGYTFNLTGCTDANATACGVVSNQTTGTVINPVMSARLTTKNSYSIKYGKIEIMAKLPRGDWLWPAFWMLPVKSVYGEWPRSGEIDIMESRGNGPEYPAQGVDFVRGSLNWGPFSWLNGVFRTFGFWTDRRKVYSDGFHLYGMEWTPKFIRIYVDSRNHKLLELKFNEPFFERGKFPETVLNGSQWILTPDPWSGASNAAPFDQNFYLIMNVAVGGTNGWFPDGAGNKPWLNGALTAMQDFAKAQDEWYATWPASVEDRAMVIDSVKMWQTC